ncbi:uncharacterized protein LOC135218639 [Macrobrachium nipponense]|uniref:uncharacterized protein LOC135218639 n=1 Tax=Macrobrachium nipponense TaxID=159736 RepID=UPI0030C88CD7
MMMDVGEGKRAGQDTGYSTASSPIWHTPQRDGSRGMAEKPKLFRQDCVQDRSAFVCALYPQASSNHCSLDSDLSDHQPPHRELQSRRTLASGVSKKAHTIRH